MRFINMSGGLGRIAAAIPALERACANGDIVITNGFEDLYTLADINFIEHSSHGLPLLVGDSDIITPEPYHQGAYRSGEYDMIDAFNVDINRQRDNIETNFAAHKQTTRIMSAFIKENGWKDEFIVVIHPQASGEYNNRSMNIETLTNAVKSARALNLFPIIVGVEDNESIKHLDALIINETTLFEYVSIIDLCDALVCVDSSAMHIGKLLDKKGIVYLQSTSGCKYYPKNFIEVRHPEHQCNFEYPRLFSAEWKQEVRNSRNLSPYVITESDFNMMYSRILKL